MAQIAKIIDEPIVIITFAWQVTPEEVEATAAEAARLAEQFTTLYWVVDLRNSGTDYPSLMRMVGQQSQGIAGTVSGEQGRVIIVGTSPFIRLFQTLMSQKEFGGVSVPIFHSLDEALASARQMIVQEYGVAVR